MLQLPPGRHLLEFRVKVHHAQPGFPMRVRAMLQGFNNEWREASDEMFLEAQFPDAEQKVTGSQRFSFSGGTVGFSHDWRDTVLHLRREPLLVPPRSVTFRLIFSCGAPESTGRAILNELTLNVPGRGLDPAQDLMRNSGFSLMDPNASPEAPAPVLWRRAGTRPDFAKSVDGPGDKAIALVDDDPQTHAEWIMDLALDDRVKAGEALSLSRKSAWLVNPGNLCSIAYQAVTAGDYEFRAAAIALSGGWTGTSLSLPVRVAPHLWERAWYWPSVTGGIVAVIALGGVMSWRQRFRRRLDRLAAQHDLEKDRARIARDMHDDLGARLTRISLLTALTEREIQSGDSSAALNHIGQLSGLAREMVGAIDEIVWAVDPGNDSLDHLGTYLCRFAAEFFANSPVRCRYRIPAVLPPVPLGAEIRHNLFLTAKEAMHNIMKHAGPCEARLQLAINGRMLHVDITDEGGGYQVETGFSGNGLRNMKRRLSDIGGECLFTSTPSGTKVSIRWPIPDKFQTA